VWLIGNHTKPPRSSQFTLGIRRLFGNYLVSVAYAGVRGVNGLVFNWANFAWNNFGTDSSSCCVGTSPFHGYQNILYTTNSVKTWYDALQVQVRRPYLRTGKIGWGAGLSMNYAKRSLQGIDNPNDEFAFPQAIFIPKHPTNDERVRVVGNWTMDVPYLYGVQFSGLLTLGSGPRQDIAGRFNPSQWVPGGFTPTHYAFIVGKWWAYRDLDLRLSKDFPSVSGNTVGVTLDLINALNSQNLGCYDTGDPNSSSFGTAHCVTQDGRRLQVGANYHF